MDSGFDLSPVIRLLHALSPGTEAAEPETGLQRLPLAHAPARLGDFSALWNFLGNEPSSTRSTTPASLLALPPPLAQDQDTDGSRETDTSTGPTRLSPIAAVLDGEARTNAKSRLEQVLGVRVQKHVAFDHLEIPPLLPVLPAQVTRPSPGARPVKSGSFAAEVRIGDELIAWQEHPVITSNMPLHVRKESLIKKLLYIFPCDAPSLAALPGSAPPMTDPKVYVFIDHSNIIIGFMDLIKQRRGYKKFDRVQKPPLAFHNLSLILERGRPVARKVLVGSLPETTTTSEARALGYDVNLLAKVEKEVYDNRARKRKDSNPSSGSDSAAKKVVRVKMGEQGVDEILNMKILESLFDSKPSILVLASGDGAVGEFGEGFFKNVERALRGGWAVELIAFAKNLSKLYEDSQFRRRWRKQFNIIYLDDFVEELLG